MSEDIISELVNDLTQEDFQPKPGGLVDRHRKAKAQREAAQHEAENQNEPIEEQGWNSVKVVALSPEGLSVVTVPVLAGAVAMLLPSSPYRYRALITVNTASASCYLAKDGGAALSGTGLQLFNGNPPLPIFSRGQLWVYNPGGSTIQVAALSELYSPEDLHGKRVRNP